MKTAEDIVNEKGRDIICVPPQTTVFEALTRMVDLKIGAILVERGNAIVGIWTERDLMRNSLSPGFDARTARIGDLMNPRVASVPHDHTTDQLLALFSRQRLRYLLVEKNGRHRGLIAVSDVIQACLTEKAEGYQRLFHSMKCGAFLCKPNGKLIDANPALLSMLGYDDKAAFISQNIATSVHPAPGDALTLIDDRHADHEIDFIAGDGRIVPGRVSSHAIRDGHGRITCIEGVVVDMSHRRAMENELRKAHAMLINVIESSPNVIIAADRKGIIFIWNHAAEETLGYSSEDVLGKVSIESLYPAGIARKIMGLLRGPDYGGKGLLRSFPMVFVRKNGGSVQVKLSAAIIYNEFKQEVATVGIFVDFEAQLDMARRLRHTQNLLAQSEKLAAMGRLTSLIAHEVNNPLYGIANTLELLKSEIPPDNAKRNILDMALSETERLSDMLRKMLSFARPEPEERQPTDINRLIDEIITLHHKQFMEKNIRMISRPGKNLGFIEASKNQLRQVLLNMISNARDAMVDGGDLEIRTRRSRNTIHILIRDTGVGISEENLGRIFDTFFTTKDEVRGVGHGLSLCYSVIKDHGGDIRVASQVGQGTTFTLILPRNAPTDDTKGLSPGLDTHANEGHSP
jgi:two-component system NtrC family sensor kinase